MTFAVENVILAHRISLSESSPPRAGFFVYPDLASGPPPFRHHPRRVGKHPPDHLGALYTLGFGQLGDPFDACLTHARGQHDPIHDRSVIRAALRILGSQVRLLHRPETDVR